MVPTLEVCSRLEAVAVTLRLPPAVLGFNVIVEAAAAESDTTALVEALRVSDVALVLATLMSELPALAVRAAVLSRPTV